MKGFSFTIEKVVAIFIGLMVALTLLGIGMTGTAGGILSDGADNVASSGCDYQRDQFFKGIGSFEGLDDRCVEQDNEQLQIGMSTAQENVQIIECMNNYVEENGNSNNIVDDLEC